MNQTIEPPTARCVNCGALSPDDANYGAVTNWAGGHLQVNRTHTVVVTSLSMPIVTDGYGPFVSRPQFRTVTLEGADA